MNKSKQVGQRAWELHNNGLHCAEAVGIALWEAYGSGPSQMLPRAASAFGGGVGRSHQEICGAFTGGVLALGMLCGRDQAGDSWDQAADLANSLLEEFMIKHGTASCRVLLKKFGPQQDTLCKGLSREVAEMAARLMEERSAS
jgi:C_GCAxxG_C_C family probable redox protein